MLLHGAMIGMSKIFEKIDVSEIISGNVSNFKKSGKRSYILKDVFLFLFSPFIISLILVIYDARITPNFSNLLVAIYSIFAGLLFSLLIFIFDVINRVKTLDISVSEASLRLETFKSVYFSVSFCILICLTNIFLLLAISLFKIQYIFAFLSFFAFYLFLFFILNLLMIIRSIHKLIYREIEVQELYIDRRARTEGEEVPRY